MAVAKIKTIRERFWHTAVFRSTLHSVVQSFGSPPVSGRDGAPPRMVARPRRRERGDRQAVTDRLS